MFNSQRYIRFHPKLNYNLQSRQQNLSLGINQVYNAEPCYPHENIVGSHLCHECMKLIWPNVSQACVHLFCKRRVQEKAGRWPWTSCHMCATGRWERITRTTQTHERAKRATTHGQQNNLPLSRDEKKLLSILWLTMECWAYQFAPKTSIWSQFASIHRIILPLSQAPLSWSYDHPCWDLKPCTTAVFLFSSSQYLFTHFWAWPSMSQDNTTVFAWSFSHPDIFSVAPAEILDSNIFLNLSIIISLILHSRWVHPKFTWSRNEVGPSKSTFFIHFFHVETIFCFFPCHRRTPLKRSWFSMNKKTFPIRDFFTSRLQKNFFELCFPHEACEWVTAQISSNRYHWMFNVSPWFWPFESWKTNPHIGTFWLVFWAVWERFPFLPLILSAFACTPRARISGTCSSGEGAGGESQPVSLLSTSLHLDVKPQVVHIFAESISTSKLHFVPRASTVSRRFYCYTGGFLRNDLHVSKQCFVSTACSSEHKSSSVPNRKWNGKWNCWKLYASVRQHRVSPWMCPCTFACNFSARVNDIISLSPGKMAGLKKPWASKCRRISFVSSS